MRNVRITSIQCPPLPEDKTRSTEEVFGLINKALEEETDYLVLNELSTTPYFCSVLDNRYFEWAETITGPVLNRACKIARDKKCSMIFPFFEKGGVEGLYYNSAAVIGPDGKLVEGILPDGRTIPLYRKNHLGQVPMLGFYEAHYFAHGQGLPVFRTPKATIGVLICKDRFFPEAWRTLALEDVEIIFVPTASALYEPERSEQNMLIMRARALDNALFAVFVNKGGTESCGGRENSYYGTSCVVSPTGSIVDSAPAFEPAIMRSEIDLRMIREQRLKEPIYRDRRPEIYKVSK
jgi:N-carbamoylputrescine amidase